MILTYSIFFVVIGLMWIYVNNSLSNNHSTFDAFCLALAICGVLLVGSVLMILASAF